MSEAEKCIPHAEQTIEGKVAIDIQYVIPKARTSKLTIPSGDIDNFAKATMDALTKKEYWTDDKNVVVLVASKTFDVSPEAHERPAGTYITIRGLERT